MSDLRAQFEEFDAANPHVWRLFVALTQKVIAAGHSHYSSDGVLHAIRWNMDVETKNEDGFKINNVYSPFYARKFMEKFPEHTGFFRLRSSVADQPVFQLESEPVHA
jgi:hypothetical protein